MEERERVFEDIKTLFIQYNQVWLMCDMIPILSITKDELPDDKLKIVLNEFVIPGHEYTVVKI